MPGRILKDGGGVFTALDIVRAINAAGMFAIPYGGTEHETAEFVALAYVSGETDVYLTLVFYGGWLAVESNGTPDAYLYVITNALNSGGVPAIPFSTNPQTEFQDTAMVSPGYDATSGWTMVVTEGWLS